MVSKYWGWPRLIYIIVRRSQRVTEMFPYWEKIHQGIPPSNTHTLTHPYPRIAMFLLCRPLLLQSFFGELLPFARTRTRYVMAWAQDYSSWGRMSCRSPEPHCYYTVYCSPPSSLPLQRPWARPPFPVPVGSHRRAHRHDDTKSVSVWQA